MTTRMNRTTRGTLIALATAIIGAGAEVALAEEGEENWIDHQRWLSMQSTPTQFLRSLQATGMRFAKAQEFAAPMEASSSGWIPVGPRGCATANANGRVAEVYVHPTGGSTYTLYVGGSTGGVWSRASSSSDWADLTTDLPQISVGAITILPGSPERIVAGTGDRSRGPGAGIFIRNADQTVWSATILDPGIPAPEWVRQVVHDPVAPTRLVAATAVGVLRSTTSAVTWSRTFTGEVLDLVVDPSNWNTQYILTRGGDSDSSGIWKSADGGVTWSWHFNAVWDSDIPAKIDQGRLAICSGTPTTVAAFVAWNDGSDHWRLLRSTDAGTTWADKTGNLPAAESQYGHAMAVAIRPTSPSDIFVASVGCYRTTNGGATSPLWNPIDMGHADATQIEFSAATGSSVAWIANDGGLYRFAFSGAAACWNGSASTGLQIGQIERGDVEWAGDGLVAGLALQDNGVQRSNLLSDLGEGDWESVGGCDGVDIEISSAQLREMYYSNWCGGPIHITRVTEDGTGTELSVADAGGGALWYDRIDKRLYAQVKDEFVGQTAVVSFDLAGGTPGGIETEFYIPGVGAINLVNVNASHLERVFIAAEWGTGRAFRAIHQLGGWDIATLSFYPPEVNATLFGYHAPVERPGEAYLCGGGLTPGQPKIWRTTDNWQSRTDITGTLVSAAWVKAIASVPFSPQELYVGTDIGVFHTTNMGQTWTPFQTGMPIAQCTDLKYIKRPDGDDLLVASTFGRGVWIRPIAGTPVVFVDPRYSDGVELGTIESPFNTIAEAQAVVPANGIIAIHGDDYPEAPITLNSPARWRVYEPPAHIGP